eukprot:TCALIF_00976-PB protein Name:"Protein of unknown function" AED:0.57 eAED:1.00 QI:0/0/0/0.5/1/1/2/0/82
MCQIGQIPHGGPLDMSSKLKFQVAADPFLGSKGVSLSVSIESTTVVPFVVSSEVPAVPALAQGGTPREHGHPRTMDHPGLSK